MKHLRIGSWLMRIAVSLYLIENIYFGWNIHPESSQEFKADTMVMILFYIGIGFYFGPLFSHYKKFVHNREQFEEGMEDLKNE